MLCVIVAWLMPRMPDDYTSYTATEKRVVGNEILPAMDKQAKCRQSSVSPSVCLLPRTLPEPPPLYRLLLYQSQQHGRPTVQYCTLHRARYRVCPLFWLRWIGRCSLHLSYTYPLPAPDQSGRTNPRFQDFLSFFRSHFLK